ncbi:SLC13 family permease [Novilysobacter spongiicola]|uniref:TrkA-C domain-containing protein n=1 Tax=Lysobacter spongiicola DSM 21749 TaxID=1122188 RepID=A0A1T4PQ69_9GAMM|nr:SLC13 family permease [Lysobacter spongiicola]SJZ93018.1 TrkA-C domain-containing protein [Lysobacter spongiicola DSM 21749]
MGMDLWLTLAVLAGAVYLFVTEKLPADVVALLVLASLMVLGLVSPGEALSGFSSQATITVAAMFVLSAGLQRSGALQGLGELLSRIRSGWLLALVMMSLIALVSGFVNNTAALAVLLPLVLAATAANRLPASKFLIPLSYAAQFGGVCTLIGTSTNLLVHSLAQQSGREGFGLFEFAPLGIIFVGVGLVYLMLARRFLLPDLGVAELDTEGHGGLYLTELVVPEKSPAIGKQARELLQREKIEKKPDDDTTAAPPAPSGPTVVLLDVIRRGGRTAPASRTELQPGDRLLLRGEWKQIETLRKRFKLRHDRVAADLEGDADAERLHAEVMVAPGSPLIGHSIAGMRLGHLYRMRVHGFQRQRALLRRPIDHIPLTVGDILLVDASESSLDGLRNDPGLVVLDERPQVRVDWRNAIISTLVLLSVVGAAATGWLPIVGAAILGSIALVVLRCLQPDEAYQAVDWRVVMLLAGVLPMGIALERSGGAAWVAQNGIGMISDWGPVVTLSVVYLLTAIMTEVMSNNAAAVLLVPVAIAAAESLGVDAKPFLVAVAFAASTSFATPVGYQTNAMVYAAGGYRFADFLRIGLPLNLIFWIMATALIPRFFPF